MVMKMFTKWATNTQEKELSEFITGLKAVSHSELGVILALANDRRLTLEEKLGWNLLDPAACIIAFPNATMTLSGAIRELQKEGKPHIAAAVMVWLHTLRSMAPASTLRMRALGREMWSELRHGMDQLGPAVATGYSAFNRILRIEGATSFPLGLHPDRID